MFKFKMDISNISSSSLLQPRDSYVEAKANSIVMNLKEKLNEMESKLAKATRKIEKREEKLWESEKEIALWKEESNYWQDRAGAREDELSRTRDVLFEKSKDLSEIADYKTEFMLLSSKVNNLEEENAALRIALDQE